MARPLRDVRAGQSPLVCDQLSAFFQCAIALCAGVVRPVVGLALLSIRPTLAQSTSLQDHREIIRFAHRTMTMASSYMAGAEASGVWDRVTRREQLALDTDTSAHRQVIDDLSGEKIVRDMQTARHICWRSMSHPVPTALLGASPQASCLPATASPGAGPVCSPTTPLGRRASSAVCSPPRVSFPSCVRAALWPQREGLTSIRTRN